MEERVVAHAMDRIAKASVHLDPYPHFFVENVFPDDFYQELIDTLPATSCYRHLPDIGYAPKGAYPERYILPLHEPEIQRLPFVYLLFWQTFARALNHPRWIALLLEKFAPMVQTRFQEKFQSLQFYTICELFRDVSNYSIGPHTDHPMRIATLLFYLPRSKEQMQLGTSLYRPKDPAFECEGKEHHTFEGFERVKTAPFLPNSVFGFVKTTRSFHGVESIGTQPNERNLINYMLKWK